MRRAAAATFLACLLVFLANGRPLPEVDCVPAPYMAWSMLRHGSWDLREHETLRRLLGGAVREMPDGAWLSMRPPGSAIAALPFVAPIAYFRTRPLNEDLMQRLGKLTAASCVAAAAALMLLVLRRLAPAAAWPSVVLFAFGTCLYSTASQALWMHGPAVFWLCAALYLLLGAERAGAARHGLAGLALGMAVLTRPGAAFFALATAATLLAQRQWRGLGWLVLGGTGPALALLHDNIAHFGHPLLGGYEDDNWAGAPPLWLGLGGLLVAPSRGLFIYAPALLLALPGAWALLRPGAGGLAPPLQAARGLLVGWTAAALLTLLFYARWHDWPGGWSYGPRLLCEAMPLACLLFALGYQRLAAGWRHHLALGLVGLSVAVQLLGVFGRDGYGPWQERHMLADQGRSLFRLQDTQIEAHARAFAARFLGGPP